MSPCQICVHSLTHSFHLFRWATVANYDFKMFFRTEVLEVDTRQWYRRSVLDFSLVIYGRWGETGLLTPSGLSEEMIRLPYLLTYSLPHSLHGAGYYLKRWLSLSLSKNVLLSYGTRRFITVFTQARHWTLSRASWIQFAPSIPTSVRSILMLSSHLRLGLPNNIFSLRSSQPKPCKHLSPLPCVPHVLPTESSRLPRICEIFGSNLGWGASWPIEIRLFSVPPEEWRNTILK
jgi:hypothetical protein